MLFPVSVKVVLRHYLLFQILELWLVCLSVRFDTCSWTKLTILIGLVITLLAGTFPMYAVAFTPILISRFLLGAGIGLFNSLAVSLIPQFYVDDEEERASMLGFQML